MSFRLIETLKSADIVAAEDTRHTRKLLTRFDIHPAHLVSYHQHNRLSRASDFVRWWAEGKSVALVSDAGTPGISDPGDDAVSLAIEHAVPVVPVPGASALLAALVASGLPSQPFAFLGFLPRTQQRAVAFLAPFQDIPGSLVCYEAPHRMARTLEAIAQLMPTRSIAVAKELTKKHESFLYGTVTEALQYFKEHQPRGEYVIVIGPPEDVVDLDPEAALASEEEKMVQAIQWVHQAVQAGESHADAVRAVAQKAGLRRKELYQRTLTVSPELG